MTNFLPKRRIQGIEKEKQPLLVIKQLMAELHLDEVLKNSLKRFDSYNQISLMHN